MVKKEFHFIDTHCHLEDDEFNSRIDMVIQKASTQKIGMISSAIRPDTWEKGHQISKQYDTVFLSIGLDPIQYQYVSEASEFISKNKDEIVAVGEIGLDHYRIRDHRQREAQANAFKNLIEIARELSVPIQVHSRSAGKKALDILEDMEAVNIHMHAFDGRSSYAQKASRDLGYYFSIPTSIVRSRQKQKMVKAIEIERLLLETDSPVLGPEKGERNVPSNITIALDEVSKILQREKEELREIILANTLRLYQRIK
ncbi:MAG: hypothetical protein GF411_16285 [Candidatus Lokiarchaeota archaeon]|nr:hypothetical protein [Candidatus Lokiarchaeota archaeon]